MKDFSGGYYSSLDADSKLEDGSYAEENITHGGKRN